MRRIGVAVVFAFALLLIPIPYLASPEWSVTVVDEVGNPISGVVVRLNYENYSIENYSHEQDLVTDANGHVTFPAHRSSASMLRRCYFTAKSALALAHASFGPQAYVNASGKGREGSVISNGVITNWTGHPDRINSRIVATPISH